MLHHQQSSISTTTFGFRLTSMVFQSHFSLGRVLQLNEPFALVQLLIYRLATVPITQTTAPKLWDDRSVSPQ